MTALTKRKTASPKKLPSKEQIKKETQKPVSKKQSQKAKKKHGLALQENVSTHTATSTLLCT